jgi:hypothetical protein
MTKPKNEDERLFIRLVNEKYGEREFLDQEEIDYIFQIARLMEMIH